jgi:hypothetical protein
VKKGHPKYRMPFSFVAAESAVRRDKLKMPPMGGILRTEPGEES